MKRFVLILASVGLVILSTACGSGKKLECSMSDEDSGLYQTMSLSFDKNDMLKSGFIVEDMKLGEDMAPYFDTIKEAAQEEFSSDDYQGMNVNITDNGTDTITVTIDFDAETASKAMGEELSDDDNYTSIKVSLEDDGYTCK